MRRASNQYDSWDRATRPTVFAGEYAVNSGVGKGNLKGALAEAAYAVRFERNADAVTAASYARALLSRGGPETARQAVRQ